MTEFFVVAKPIGNLGDITFRAIEILKNCDIILCEDSRITNRLLIRYNIENKKLVLYNDNSSIDDRKNILKMLLTGSNIAFVSDAGTPLISDPGYKLVKEVKEKGYFIDIAPGVSAPIAALTLSGLPSDRFIFAGFLPKTDIGKEKVFLEFAEVDATLIFFDRSTRIVDSLQVALKILGNREANVSRELTKLFQESRTSDIESLIKYYSHNLPKGEIVLLISGKKSLESSEEKLITEIKNLLILGTHTKDITQQLFQKYHKHYKKSKIYKICNSLKGTKHRI